MMYVCVHLYTIRYYTVHGSWAVQLSALVNGFQNICCWILGHCRREWSNMIQMFRTWWDTTHWLPTAKCPRLQLGSGPWKSSPSIGWLYPLVMTNIAIENGNRNSGFTHEKIVIFHSYVSLPEGNVSPYFTCNMPCHSTPCVCAHLCAKREQCLGFG